MAVIEFGPEDHGRTLTLEQYKGGRYLEGYQYEIIDGQLYVTPSPTQSHDWVEKYLYEELCFYSQRRKDAVNRISTKAGVFVPNATRLTAVAPDLAAYRDFPMHRQPYLEWEDVSPILVVEIISPFDSEKDLVRNVDLYRQVPSIQECWVLDNRQDAARPTTRVFRRAGDGIAWDTQDVAFGETYTTPLLPEFSLVVDPGRQSS